ncbi:probable disease resistance RPP8-like protein 2 [Salvia hispanica]|uniref:probable disease resistance RPP8-like protein 2 n=1 Tax=Salvia hispanica TaxID=49212 RepID=UPI00200969FD|nr:probable disease resistance RPP8-like protein 2 [Salvia hispanica]
MAATIGSDCSGLPLAIHVIKGLLSKVERSRNVWYNFSTDIKASIVESDEHFSSILSLSYNHLPIRLKPCFLYMGAFPEDYEIKGSRLKSMWIGEEFVKYNGDKSLEDEAEDYLKALVERNLDLCIRKANKEKFLNVKNSLRRVSILSPFGIEDIDSGARCNEQGFPIGISKLWNLQTLICQQPTTLGLPSEIWEMSELRHLKLYTTIEIGKGYNIRCACKKLQTIYFVRITPSLIRSGFFEIIPNVIKLGIYYIDSPDTEVDLSHLRKLEKLRCESELNKDGSRFLHQLIFPCNIRKLVLVGSVVFRSFLTTLCALPNLEVLVISDCVFERDGEAEEEVWEVTEGDEFRSLQCLRLISLNIVHWRADETNFPILRELYVTGCNDLEEIP